MSPFETNYGYTFKTLLSFKQAKKSNKIAKKIVKKLITLYKELYKLAKMVLKKMKQYYNKKRSEGPDLKKGDKVWLLHKNFEN